MLTKIATVTCAALLVCSAGCKKDKGKAKEKASDKETGGKTAEGDATKPAREKPKLDSAEDKIAFYRGCVSAMSAQDWDKLGACYADTVSSEMIDSGMPTLKSRDEILEAGVKSFATAFPDMKVAPTLILQNGNRIASIGVMTGTHTGPMKGPMGEIPPSNKKVGGYGLHIVEIDPAAGGIVKEWHVYDMGTLMAQIGVNPMPARAPAEAPTGEPTIVMAKSDDTEKANLAAFHAAAVDAFNKHDVKAMAASYTPDAKFIDISEPADMDAKGAVKAVEGFFKAFPDIKTEVTDEFAAGDYVVAFSPIKGTNTGDIPAMKMKKTGKALSITPVKIMKFAGGKIQEKWIFTNGMAFAMQLGLIPDAPADDKAAAGGDKAGGDKAGGDKAAAGGDKPSGTK